MFQILVIGFSSEEMSCYHLCRQLYCQQMQWCFFGFFFWSNFNTCDFFIFSKYSIQYHGERATLSHSFLCWEGLRHVSVNFDLCFNVIAYCFYHRYNCWSISDRMPFLGQALSCLLQFIYVSERYYVSI